MQVYFIEKFSIILLPYCHCSCERSNIKCNVHECADYKDEQGQKTTNNEQQGGVLWGSSNKSQFYTRMDDIDYVNFKVRYVSQ